ncbi:MAG: sulfatase-like hydrolase/transferase [Sphingobacteriales bacterium]|nr:sulfatase-like hydrolase/transferase [Sphingobacteriales bacterium]
MKNKTASILEKPFFLLLLPLFFFLHGLLANYNVIIIKDAVLLFFFYTGVAIGFAFLFWLWYRNVLKACLAAFVLMSANFFFGNGYELLKKLTGDSFFIKYSFLLPVIAVTLTVIIIAIKRTKYKLLQIAKYLNLIFTLFILIDAVSLFLKISKSKKNHVTNLSGQFSRCDTCTKPDIYLIVVDEYAGKKELQDLFSFDNTGFETELQNRGFHIVNNTVANYNSTIYSMASMLNMDYLANLHVPVYENHKDVLICREVIKSSQVVKFLKQAGYSIHNNSFFDINDKEKAVENMFPKNAELLTDQTLIKRIIRVFGARIVSKRQLINFKKRELSDNIKVEQLTDEAMFFKSKEPKFVYSHFNMPHWPYFFDKTGKETPIDSLTDEYKDNKKAYTEYLQYCNEKMLQIIDKIIRSSTLPPVVILMSDHGFRQFHKAQKADRKYYFMNLNTVLLPSANYSGFYNGMSNVNQFRVILNTVFNQKLPMLKDSVSFLW